MCSIHDDRNEQRKVITRGTGKLFQKIKNKDISCLRYHAKDL
jgi:hypothetical protein